MKIILKVLVGSQAHGLANELSDTDYRGVFLVPTTEVLGLTDKIKNTSWIEGKEDDTSWEIKHFLQMTVRCNPTVLEVFHAPIVSSTEAGLELRDLFKYAWNKKDVLNSHLGYGANQRTKFIEDKDKRGNKYATAWLRTVYQAYSLFTNGTYPVDFTYTPVYTDLLRIKAGTVSRSQILDICERWEKNLQNAAANFTENPDLDPKMIEKFLVKVRIEDLNS